MDLIKDITADQIKFNFSNIKFSNDNKTVSIVGPVFSKEAFVVAKGAKTADLLSAFNISLFKDGATPNTSGTIKNEDKLVKIEINADGSATVVKWVAN